MEVFENIIWITEEPADGAQASKHSSGLSNADKEGKFSILSTGINVSFFVPKLLFEVLWSSSSIFSCMTHILLSDQITHPCSNYSLS